MEIYLNFVIQSSFTISDFKAIPEARNLLIDKMMSESLIKSDGFVYCSRSIILLCFFDHEISPKINFWNVRFPSAFQFFCRMP